MEQLEFLTEVQDLRKVWPHEALDFTPWLAKDENIAILGNEIGMEIAVDGTESAVGDFSVDIIATDIATGQKVIIENQLEDTNHDHLLRCWERSSDDYLGGKARTRGTPRGD